MHNKGIEYFHDLDRIYGNAIKQTENDIARWYLRYAKNEKVSLAEAKKQLTKNELKEFRMSVEEYVKKGESLDPKWAAELERASTKFHVTRLEALKMQMQQNVEYLMAQQADGVDKLMRDIFTDSYYHSAFEIQKGIGVGWDLMKLDKNVIDKAMSKPWTADGTNFSERIWGKYRPELVKKLHDGLTLNLIQGKSPDKLIDEITKQFNVKRHQAENLVQTEKAYFQSLAQKDAFKTLGIEEYGIVATLDSKTSDICREMDGKHFKLDDFTPGATAPPFHNRCRTATAPYFNDEFTVDEERAARDDSDGSYYTVPGNMKYKEWYDKYVKEEAKQKDLLNAVKLAMSLQLNNLTDDEKDVLTKMTGALSQKINYNIGHGESLDKFADQIELIDSAINKGVIPEDLDLIRKTIPQYVFSNAKKIDLEFLQSQIGRIIENPIYSSTSFIDFNYPLRNLVIHLKVPKGYKGALYIRDIAYNKYKGQEEVLFKRGLKYRIYDAKIEDDKYVLFAEVIDDEKRRR
nr:MAG TPA: minor capsid protein [Caudoviricetes sp.]